ncbi:response regulator [Methylomicrobium sp. RS1]|uniref:response regulator n=1 Tax=Candidatus Methylomicrobium oryzae TaxID=2802053 RepID=UPI0019213206|nr:response regulator [Methylomicrobium sp. RS1]MBL1263231.1 response regulator [Methylomicrobium sp. RS1]
MIDATLRHELLNALNRIIGYAEILIEEAADENRQKQCDDLTIIRCAAQGVAQHLKAAFSGQPFPDAACGKGVSPSGTAIGQVHTPAGDDKTGGSRILVVDDDPDNRAHLSRLLHSRGYRITTADNGAAALARLADERFDLILLDVIMPEMDGITVLARLKADKTLGTIPIILISACTEMNQVIRGIELGAEDYLPKPFNSTLLHARIGASLEKKRLRDREMRLIGQTVLAEAALDRHRALTQAVAGIAHEINTPLGIVRTALSVIQNRLSQPAIAASIGTEHAEPLEDILEAAALMGKHVDHTHRLIENFKKIAVDQMAEQQETVNLPETVQDAVDLFKLSAREAKLEISLDVSGIRQAPEWHGYPGYLRQILLNFLQNIERYAYPDGRGGRVEITVKDGMDAEQHTPIFMLSARDFGAGIDSGHLTKIFDPFFTTGRGRGGTGLGLAIVKNMVTMALRGRISVDSESHKGTCFTITFPKQ